MMNKDAITMYLAEAHALLVPQFLASPGRGHPYGRFEEELHGADQLKTHSPAVN